MIVRIIGILLSRIFITTAIISWTLLSPQRANAQTVLSTCREITQPGSYVLSNTIEANNTVCINIHDTSNVQIDCRGFSIKSTKSPSSPSTVKVTNVSNYSLKNCVIDGQDNGAYLVDISKSPYGTITDSRFSSSSILNVGSSNNLRLAGNTSDAAMQILYSDYITIENNTIKLRPNISRGSLITLVGGTGSVIRNNYLDGSWNRVQNMGLGDWGADDGIVISTLSNAAIQGNVILNNWDCGIETDGLIESTRILDNQITTAAFCGIGGWYGASLLGNTISGNVVTDTPQFLHFTRDDGLRPGEQAVYFKNNTFAKNKHVKPMADIGSHKASYIQMGQHPAIPNSAWVYGPNTFTNNDFGNIEAPLFYSMPDGAIVDGGGNTCLWNSILRCAEPSSTVPAHYDLRAAVHDPATLSPDVKNTILIGYVANPASAGDRMTLAPVGSNYQTAIDSMTLPGYQNGTLVFNAPPLTPGKYEFRYFRAGASTPVAVSYPITVAYLNINFQITPETVLPQRLVTISWDAPGASIKIEPGIGDRPSSGSATVVSSVTTTYKLTARQGSYEKTATATLTVSPSATPTPTLAPTTIPTAPPINPIWTPTATPTPAQAVVIVVPANLTVMPGRTVTFPVTLSGPAPSGGVFLSLTSSDSSKVNIPNATVYFAPGQSAPSNMPTINGLNSGSATLSASAFGYASKICTVQIGEAAMPTQTPVLTVKPTGAPTAVPTTTAIKTPTAILTPTSIPTATPTPAQVVSIVVPASLTVPTASTLPFPVSLSGPAPSGGVFLSLSASDSSKVSILNPNVFILTGQTAPTDMPAITGLSTGSVTITASGFGYGLKSCTVQIGHAATATPTPVPTVKPTGVPTAAPTPTATKTATATPMATPTPPQVVVIVVPASLAVAVDGTVPFPVTLSGPAPAGGVFLSLSASDSSKVGIQNPTIYIMPGQTAPSNAPAITGLNAGSATVTATAFGYPSVISRVSVNSSLRADPSPIGFVYPADGNLVVTNEVRGRVPHDFDGDGKSDLALRRGKLYEVFTSIDGESGAVYSGSTNAKQIGYGDINGDKVDELITVNPSIKNKKLFSWGSVDLRTGASQYLGDFGAAKLSPLLGCEQGGKFLPAVATAKGGVVTAVQFFGAKPKTLKFGKGVLSVACSGGEDLTSRLVVLQKLSPQKTVARVISMSGGSELTIALPSGVRNPVLLSIPGIGDSRESLALAYISVGRPRLAVLDGARKSFITIALPSSVTRVDGIISGVFNNRYAWIAILQGESVELIPLQSDTGSRTLTSISPQAGDNIIGAIR